MLIIATTTQAANLFEPVSGDLSVKILNSLFGGLVGVGGNDPLLNAIKIFNSSILVVGGILAAYTIFAGTVGTAHDGEMLGKKFSSVWIPIRYSIGTALILPVVGGGYCVMQAIVMWLVMNGIGLADQVYLSFMSNPVLNKNIKVSTYGDHGTLALAENIFAMNVCVEGHNKAQDGKWLNLFGKTIYSVEKHGNKIHFGSNRTASSFAECGTITLPDPLTVEAPSNQDTQNQGLLGHIGNLYQSVDFNPIVKEHEEQTLLLNKKLQALAKSSVDNYKELNPSSTYQQIEQYANEYKQAIEQKGKEFSSNLNLLESAMNNGWLTAGFTFVSDITVNNNLNSAIRSVSQANANMFYTRTDAYEKDAEPYLNVAKSVLSRSKTPQVAQRNNDNQVFETETGSSLSGKFGAAIAQAFTTINLYELKDDSRHPIITINEMGQRIITANTTIIASLSLLAGIAGGAALIAGSGVSAAVNIFTSFFALPIGALWTIGIISSYVIPFIPAFIWIGSIIGFVLLVIEAIIAAPLWAVMHLHPNGDDLTGKGNAGYSLVLSLLLRPTLMIFGFIAALIISTVMGELINKIFFQIFSMNNGGSIQGFFSLFVILGGTAIYCTLMFIVLRKTFSLVNMLPDQLLRWISGPTEQLGQFASEFDSSTTSATKAGTAAVLGAAVATKSTFVKGLEAGGKYAEGSIQTSALDRMQRMIGGPTTSKEPGSPGGEPSGGPTTGNNLNQKNLYTFTAQAQAHQQNSEAEDLKDLNEDDSSNEDKDNNDNKPL